MTDVRDRLPSYDPGISRIFFSISLIIPITLVLALALYREPFFLLRDAFSELGETLTSQGRSNTIPRLIFSVGWLICSVLMVQISYRYGKRPAMKNATFKRWLAMFGGIGFLVAITPNDVNHIVHSIGMGLVVGVTYVFGVLFLIELRTEVGAPNFLWLMLLLQTTVLTYAVAFFLNASIKQAAQKLCVIGLLLVVEKAATIGPEGFEWRAALQAIRK